MFNFTSSKLARAATAAVGALVFSTTFVAAAVGPAAHGFERTSVTRTA